MSNSLASHPESVDSFQSIDESEVGEEVEKSLDAWTKPVYYAHWLLLTRLLPGPLQGGKIKKKKRRQLCGKRSWIIYRVGSYAEEPTMRGNQTAKSSSPILPNKHIPF